MKISLRDLMQNVVVWFLNSIVHPVWRSLSVIELIVILACFSAAIGVVANGWDIYQQKKRSYIRNGAKLTLSKGDWRRVIADSLQILSFLGIGIVYAIAPTSPIPSARTRSAIVTLFLLGILAVIVYNQVNSFYTRRKATIQLDALYDRVHHIERSQIDD